MPSDDERNYRKFNMDHPSNHNSIMFFEREFESDNTSNFGDQLVMRTLKYMNADVSTVFVPRQRGALKNGRSQSDSDILSSLKKYPSDMPPESEISNKFHKLVESMNLSTEYTQQLMTTSISHKWALLKGQESVSEGRHSVAFYLCQLERHLDPQLVRNPSKKLLKGLYTTESLLTSLEVDLRSNPNATWLREFIDEPNSGHVILLKMLKHIQERSNQTNHDKGTYSKMKKLDLVLSKEPNEEHLCVLCIKAIVRNKYGFHKILSAPRSLATMAWSLRLSNLKTRIAVLKIFSEACEHPGGFDKTLQALEDYKQYKQEKHRFQCLVHSVIYGNRLANLVYQECVIRFFNTIINNAPSLNQRVFHQQELELAGFTAEKVEQCLEGLRAESVREELSIWRNNYIDVATTLDEFVALRGRSTLLRDEVDFLQIKLEEVGRDKSRLYLEKKELERKVDEYKLRASEIHGQIENIKSRKRSEAGGGKGGVGGSGGGGGGWGVGGSGGGGGGGGNFSYNHTTNEIQHVLETAVEEILRPNTPLHPPLPPPSQPQSPTKKLTTRPEENSFIPSAPPPPVPPPPIFGAKFNNPNDSNFKTSNVRLPLLHWQPINAPSENSIFMQAQKDLDLTDGIDFTELDMMFELKQNAIAKHSTTREKALKKLSDQITVLNSNKARNLLIARKRISLSSQELQKAISTCDIVALSPECAELLLKFTPTNEERSSLLKCSEDFDKLGDAEKFLYQLLQVERLEAKLNTIAFMGAFDELFRTVSPQIEAIITACITVATSDKLKKLIGLILAYGNYINGGRRGIVQGFKLESLNKLEDIKTNDKKTNFLQYLVDVIRGKFPDLHNFHEELEIQPALNIAMETLAGDVQQLRKGLDLTKSEREKQPDSFAIHEFYTRSATKVQNISERYRKMEDQFKEVCQLFCENPKTVEPSALFQSIHKFTERYKRATKEIDIKVQSEKTLKKAELLKQQHEKQRTKSSTSFPDNPYSQYAISNDHKIDRNRPLSHNGSYQLRLIQAGSMENMLDDTHGTLTRSYTDSRLLKSNELSKSTSYLDSASEEESVVTKSINGGEHANIYSKSFNQPNSVLNNRPSVSLTANGVLNSRPSVSLSNGKHEKHWL